MAGKKTSQSDDFDDYDEDTSEFEMLVESELEVPSKSAKSKLAWQRLEQRAENQWLNSQLSDWDDWDDSFDTH